MNFNIQSVVGLGKSGLMTIAIIIGTTTTPSAQNISRLQNSTFNGLFTPTAAQKFFETGRNNFEREIDSVIDSEDRFSNDILQLEEAIKQMKETNSIQNAQQNNPQNER